MLLHDAWLVSHMDKDPREVFPVTRYSSWHRGARDVFHLGYGDEVAQVAEAPRREVYAFDAC